MSKQKVNEPNPKKSLDAVLLDYPDIAIKLREAIETGHFLITISCQKKLRPDDPHDLQHYWRHQNYQAQDVVTTLEHLKRDFVSKVMPAAAQPDPKGGQMF